MADSDGAGSKGAPPLEQQTRDEILQHCKRQFLLLQRTKAKLDENRKERETVESQLKAQLEEVSKDRDDLKSRLEQKSSHETQRIHELESSIESLQKELSEFKNASREKNDLANELGEATNELNLLREEKRELLEKLDSLEAARDAALELEKRMAQALDETQSLRTQLKEATEQLSAAQEQKLPGDSTENSEIADQTAQEFKEALEKLAQAELQLKQMEEEKVEWQARETRTRCRVEELESNVQVLTADLDNDRQHICALTEALEKAEGEETNAKNSLQRLQGRVDELISSSAVSCEIIFASSEKQIERFSRFCLDTLLALVELNPPAPPSFDRLSTGLKAISDDFVRCDHRRAQAEQRARELSSRLDGALDEAEACKVKVDSARAALESEKKLREEVERRSLETAEECDILRSTITALTNQLEEAQVHLSQLLMAREVEERSREANSTDDDKNSSDDARTEQIAAFRDRISCLESDLAKERCLREAAQRSSDSATEELSSMRIAACDAAKALEEMKRSRDEDLVKLTSELEAAESRVAILTDEVSKARKTAEGLEHTLEEKSALVEKLHDTIDSMVERANSGISTRFEGNSALARLLRCLEDLASDFSKAGDVERIISDIEESNDADERCVRRMLQALLGSVRAIATREDASESSVAAPIVLAPPPTASDPPTNTGDVDTLMKLKDAEVRERDEKIVKLKNLLVKMKRELVTVKAAQEQQAPNILASNIQSLQTEYDKAVDELEAEKKLNRELQKKVTQTVDQVAEMELKSSQLEDDKRQLLLKVEQAEQSVKDALQAKAEAEAQVLVVSNELDKARSEMDRLRQELSQQIQNVTALQVEASALQQQVELGRSAIDDAQLMDERSRQLEQEAKSVHARLEEMATAKAELEVRLAELEISSAEVDNFRSRCEQLEEANDTLVKEVADATRRLDESETKFREASALLAAEKEALKAAELQVAARVQEAQQLQASLQNQRDAQSRLVRTLEGKAASLKKDYATVKLELDETKKEFEAYKIKAHSMIKVQERPDQKKKKELVDDGVIGSLKLKIDELNQELKVSKAELEAAHEQLSRLQDRYDSLQKDVSQRSQDFKKRLTSALEEREKEVRAEMLAQETLRLEEAAARHRDELARKEQAQKTMIEILEDKLVEVRAELDAMKDVNKAREVLDRSPDLHNGSSNDVFLEPVRQPAEGSESTDAVGSMRGLPFDVIPTSGFQPLDKLLEHQEVPSFETFESVTTRLEDAMKRIDHFTELLNDSEVNNLRLSEQVRVLKEEVRRLERNKERDDEFGNLEYLKNVVLKYLTMKSERERLVPVLVTILKLSPDEKRALQQGEQGWGLLPKFL